MGVSRVPHGFVALFEAKGSEGGKKETQVGQEGKGAEKMNKKNEKGDAKKKRRSKKPPPAEHEASVAGLVPRNITVCSTQVQLLLLLRMCLQQNQDK